MSEAPFPFSFRGEFADGQSLEFVPTAVRPLGLAELAALSAQPDASMTLQCLAENPKINGETVAGTGRMDGRLTFSQPVTIFALVPDGGWLPVPFVSPQHFLLDRNVVANFRKLRQQLSFTKREAQAFWTRFFEEGTPLFNPLPYAFEGRARRIPSLEEFVCAFEQGVREVEETFPRSRVAHYSPAHYVIAYAQLQALHTDTPREIEFLCEIAPLLAVPTSDPKLRAVADRILETVARLGVDRQSLVVLTALSCLFEDPRSGAKSIARKILNPKQTYAAEDAYNAICDLRHIILAAVGHKWVTQGRFALCTSDWAAASLWCALGIRDVVATATGVEFAFDFSPALFPRLDEVAIKEIAGLLCGEGVSELH